MASLALSASSLDRMTLSAKIEKAVKPSLLVLIALIIPDKVKSNRTDNADEIRPLECHSGHPDNVCSDESSSR